MAGKDYIPANCILLNVEGPENFSALARNSSLYLVITNNSDQDIEFGEYYNIQKFENGIWTSLPLDVYFSDILYHVAPGAKKRIPFTLENGAYCYLPGKYRMVKDVQLKGGAKVDLFYNFVISDN
jgi:hypothetical protein